MARTSTNLYRSRTSSPLISESEIALPGVADILAGVELCQMINGELYATSRPVRSRQPLAGLNQMQPSPHCSTTAEMHKELGSNMVGGSPPASVSSGPSTPRSSVSGGCHSSPTASHDDYSDSEPETDFEEGDCGMQLDFSSQSSSFSCTTGASRVDAPSATSDPLFAVFRPNLALAASGVTLAAMHREWRARWPGEIDPSTFPSNEAARQAEEDEAKRKPFACPFCRRRFDRPSIRQTHMNSHTGDRPHKCKHSGCTKTFSVLSNKYRHERSHDLSEAKAKNKSAKKRGVDAS